MVDVFVVKVLLACIVNSAAAEVIVTVLDPNVRTLTTPESWFLKSGMVTDIPFVFNVPLFSMTAEMSLPEVVKAS